MLIDILNRIKKALCMPTEIRIDNNISVSIMVFLLDTDDFLISVFAKQIFSSDVRLSKEDYKVDCMKNKVFYHRHIDTNYMFELDTFPIFKQIVVEHLGKNILKTLKDEEKEEY